MIGVSIQYIVQIYAINNPHHDSRSAPETSMKKVLLSSASDQSFHRSFPEFLKQLDAIHTKQRIPQSPPALAIWLPPTAHNQPEEITDVGSAGNLFQKHAALRAFHTNQS